MRISVVAVIIIIDSTTEEKVHISPIPSRQKAPSPHRTHFCPLFAPLLARRIITGVIIVALRCES